MFTLTNFTTHNLLENEVPGACPLKIRLWVLISSSLVIMFWYVVLNIRDFGKEDSEKIWNTIEFNMDVTCITYSIYFLAKIPTLFKSYIYFRKTMTSMEWSILWSSSKIFLIQPSFTASLSLKWDRNLIKGTPKPDEQVLKC